MRSFVQYERVDVKVNVLSDLPEGGVFADHASALAATPKLELSIDGPERITREVPLASISDETSRDGGHRWLVQPTHELVIDLGRIATPGEYRVRLTGANAHVDPERFRIVPEVPVAMVGLTAELTAAQASAVHNSSGTFIVAGDGDEISVRAISGGSTRIPHARWPRAAAAETGIAIAYATTEGAPRVALLDRSLRVSFTVDLGTTDASAFQLFASPRGWIVAWTSNDALTAAEIDVLRRDGAMVPIDNRARRVWMAEVDDGGRVLQRKRVGDGLLLAAVAAVNVTSARYTLMSLQPADEPACLGRAIEKVRLIVLDASFDERGSGEWFVGHCHVPAGGIAAGDKRTVAMAASCSGDSREILLLDVTADGHVTFAKAIDHVDPGFEAVSFEGEIWLAFASVDERVARRQLEIARFAAAGLDTAVVGDGHDEIKGIELLSSNAGITEVVRSSRGTKLIELKRGELTSSHHHRDLRDGVEACGR